MLRRLIAAGLAVMVIAAAILQATVWPTGLRGYGDSISAAGLAITLIGFVLTFLEIRDIRKDALETIRKIGDQLLVTAVAEALHLASAGREASRDGNWHRAIERCQAARLLLLRASHNPHLSQDEQTRIRSWAHDLRLISNYIEAERLNRDPPQKNLPKKKKDSLDDIVAGLGHIQGRLQGAVLEV